MAYRKMESRRDNRELSLKVNWQSIVTNCPSWSRLWEKLLAEPAETPRVSQSDGVQSGQQHAGGEG